MTGFLFLSIFAGGIYVCHETRRLFRDWRAFVSERPTLREHRPGSDPRPVPPPYDWSVS